MSEEERNELSKKIDILNFLIGLQVVEKYETTIDRVWILHKSGFTNKEIARILEIKTSIVRARISDKKKDLEEEILKLFD